MKPRARPPKTTCINILNRNLCYRCPVCKREFKTVISLLGHAISRHKINLLALEQHKKGRVKRPRRTELSYIKLPPEKS